MNIFSRREGESVVGWVLRIHLDPWFEDATPDEISDFTGVSLRKVRRAVYNWAKSKKVRRIHQHATSVAEQIGWPGTPEALVHIALERYAQRFKDFERREYTRLDNDIERFLAQHKTQSELN